MTKAEPSFAGALRFGSTTVPYTVRRQNRSDLSISVLPDLRVEVLAPRDRPRSEIEAKLVARSAWILRQQLRFRDMHPLPIQKKYVAGESFRYLGRQYRLRVVRGDSRSVALQRPFLVVELDRSSGRSRAAIEQLVMMWYTNRSRLLLPRYFERVMKNHPNLGAQDIQLRVRRMKVRWGSCSPNGVITLNPELIQTSPRCIEYVIVHELCHLRIMNHGPSFQQMISRAMPDWKVRRDEINTTKDIQLFYRFTASCAD